MQQSPLKDKDLGIVVGGYDGVKFSEIRQKSLKEYVDRKNKRKKEKVKVTPVPAACPGQQIVCTGTGYGNNCQEYYLYEIVDFMITDRVSFKYFGILLKTSDKSAITRIGRLNSFGDGYSWIHGSTITKLTEDKIKWLETK